MNLGFRGGVALGSPVSAQLLDFFNQLVAHDKLGTGVPCVVKSSSAAVEIGGKVSGFTANGIMWFNSTSFSAIVGKYYNFTVSCAWSRQSGRGTVQLRKSGFNMRGFHEQCAVGEFTTVLNGLHTHCQVCKPVSYSLLKGSFACTKCPNGAVCDGGATLNATKGTIH